MTCIKICRLKRDKKHSRTIADEIEIELPRSMNTRERISHVLYNTSSKRFRPWNIDINIHILSNNYCTTLSHTYTEDVFWKTKHPRYLETAARTRFCLRVLIIVRSVIIIIRVFDESSRVHWTQYSPLSIICNTFCSCHGYELTCWIIKASHFKKRRWKGASKQCTCQMWKNKITSEWRAFVVSFRVTHLM